MKRLLWTVALVTAPCLMAVPAVAADTIVTGPLDQAGFQALIYGANPGDTILCLGGVYDFTAGGPVWIDRSLTIQAADPGDPPVFVGDGTWYTDPVTGNNGFAQTLGSFIDGLTLQGLHFEGFDRALMSALTLDISQPGCPEIPGAGAKNVKILDNFDRNSRRFFQAFSGPFEDFVVKGNDSDASQFGILVYGSAFFCEADGTYYPLVSPANGVIQGNHLQSGFASIYVDAGERISVKENYIEGGFAGILFIDDTAFYFPEVGPIRLGDVKANSIENAVFGIYLEGPTTVKRTQVKDNEIDGAWVGIILDFGANGFEVKANHFAMSGLADVYLAFDEDNPIPDDCGIGIDSDGVGCEPNAYNNVVKVYEGDLVVDFGVDNVVKVE